MAGRPPKPHEQHVKEGTLRPDRHANLPVVLGSRDLTAYTPTNLTERQTKLWDWMIEELDASRVLQTTDLPMLEQFVIAVDYIYDARKDIAENGVVIDEERFNKDGEVVGTVRKKNPAFSVWKDAVSVAKSLAEQFGLTPSARARLGIQNIVGISAAKQLERSLGGHPLDVLEGEAEEVDV